MLALALPLIACSLSLLPALDADKPMARTAIVTAEDLAAFNAPDDSAFIVAHFRRGEVVRVFANEDEHGWTTVAPGKTGFVWIEREAIRQETPGSWIVDVPHAVTRFGLPGGRIPGPNLERGTVVRRTGRPVMEIPTASGKAQTWVAIVPPEATRLYVRSEGLQRTADEHPAPPEEKRASFEEAPTPDPPPMPAQVAEEIVRLDAEHRAAISGSVETWRVEPIRGRYEFLLKKQTDPEAIRILQGRIQKIERHEAMAKSARAFRTVLDSSRRRDAHAAVVARKLAEADQPERQPFIAEGLLQPSSRQVDGRRVFALIGVEGAPIAYLDIPPGLDARRLLAKQVGVRGATHYSDVLHARLILVKDIERLD